MTGFDFIKMHALGNDFVILDGVRQPDIVMTKSWAAILADRHTGIGFDQLLWLLPDMGRGGDFSVRLFNANGSEAGQCGNGMRCLGRYIWDYHQIEHNVLKLVTPSTQVKVIRQDADILVDLPQPDFTAKKMPCHIDHLQVIAWPHHCQVDGRSVTFGCVNLGNPHVVIWVEDFSQVDMDATAHHLQTHRAFPDSVNVGFAKKVHNGAIQSRVYERGAGATQACGSGACAAVIVGRNQSRGLADRVHVIQPGGTQIVTWCADKQVVRLAGALAYIFNGHCHANSVCCTQPGQLGVEENGNSL